MIYQVGSCPDPVSDIAFDSFKHVIWCMNGGSQTQTHRKSERG